MIQLLAQKICRICCREKNVFRMNGWLLKMIKSFLCPFMFIDITFKDDIRNYKFTCICHHILVFNVQLIVNHEKSF